MHSFLDLLSKAAHCKQVSKGCSEGAAEQLKVCLMKQKLQAKHAVEKQSAIQKMGKSREALLDSESMDPGMVR